MPNDYGNLGVTHGPGGGGGGGGVGGRGVKARGTLSDHREPLSRVSQKSGPKQ